MNLLIAMTIAALSISAPEPSALDRLDAKIARKSGSGAPELHSFREYLETCAKVPTRRGNYGSFSFEGRAPLLVIVEWIDKVLANCLRNETVEIDGVEFKPGTLKGAVITVGGGAQWGKTVLVLNFEGYITTIEFMNFGYYTPDQELLSKIVDTKFRPDVLDQNPWMSAMIQVGKAESASGKTVNRKNSYQVSAGDKKAFGHFCGMQKPPTTISLDAAALDEVDDIPLKNMGYVDGRMTNSPLQLRFEIGTQRVAGAGQNARVESGSFHTKMTPCKCGLEWNLEEHFPSIVRVAVSGTPAPTDPKLTPERGHDRNALYYFGCPDCGLPLNRDSGKYVARNPDKIRHAHLSIRVSQFSISAISVQEIVGAWFAALNDPSGTAITAFYCDRVAIPNAGAAQPITQKVIERAREEHAMSLTTGSAPRFAGLDTGPRCWFWADEKRSEMESALVWAEMIASGNAIARTTLLMQQLGIECVFADAGGEPDLTKRLCLALNGLENYEPPMMPRNELLKAHLVNIGGGVTWNGPQARWTGIKAAAVLFTASEAAGITQTIGFTQDGKIYPLIKCNRAESITTTVNDFLTPEDGVIEMVDVRGTKLCRTEPRARLPLTYIGPGASQAVLENHLLNLRKEKNPTTGVEDWVDKVENHLGLARVYARLAQTVGGLMHPGIAGRFIPPTGRRAEAIKERRDRRVIA